MAQYGQDGIELRPQVVGGGGPADATEVAVDNSGFVVLSEDNAQTVTNEVDNILVGLLREARSSVYGLSAVGQTVSATTTSPTMVTDYANTVDSLVIDNNGDIDIQPGLYTVQWSVAFTGGLGGSNSEASVTLAFQNLTGTVSASLNGPTIISDQLDDTVQLAGFVNVTSASTVSVDMTYGLGTIGRTADHFCVIERVTPGNTDNNSVYMFVSSDGAVSSEYTNPQLDFVTSNNTDTFVQQSGNDIAFEPGFYLIDYGARLTRSSGAGAGTYTQSNVILQNVIGNVDDSLVSSFGISNNYSDMYTSKGLVLVNSPSVVNIQFRFAGDFTSLTATHTLIVERVQE